MTFDAMAADFTTTTIALWAKPAEFKEAADKFVAAAASFHTLAQAGDIAAIGQGMKALGGTCKGCHDKFREAD